MYLMIQIPFLPLSSFNLLVLFSFFSPHLDLFCQLLSINSSQHQCKSFHPFSMTSLLTPSFFVCSQSDIYFLSSAPVSSASNCSSKDTSSQSSPQTPTGYEMPVFPSPLGDGKKMLNLPSEGSHTSTLPVEVFDFG